VLAVVVLLGAVSILVVVVLLLQPHGLCAEPFRVPARGTLLLAYVSDCFAPAISSNVILVGV
jgi:hypothetical protein